MSQTARSRWPLIVRVAVREVAAPLAAAVAAGTLVAPLVSPEWKAAGQPWFLGQAKNAEQAMVSAGFLAAAAVPWLLRSAPGRLAVGLVAAVGAFILAAKGSPFLLSNAPGVILASTLAASLSIAWGRSEGMAAPPWSFGAGGLRLAAWAFAASALACLTGIFSTIALPIDAFHDGEVLSSALDFLGGGRPFETFVWPHGLHDTGLAAFWILVTGKVGTSPVVLAYATCSALGVLTASVLAKALNCTAHEALAAAAAIALPFLTGVGPGIMDLLSPFRLGVMYFVVVGFAVLVSPSRHRERWAGLCFGLAYLFRVEVGLYGVVACGAVMTWRSLGNGAATAGERSRRVAWSLLQFFAGMALCLGACRAAFGWPGRAWFEYTLGILPRYHRDATGLFVPWFGDASRPANSPEALLLAWLVFVALLVAQTIAHMVAGPGVKARAERLLFLSVFAVLATRSAVDRSDSEHIRQWMSLPLLGVLLMALTAVREGWRLEAGRSAAACFSLVGLLSMFGGFFPTPLWQSPSSEIARTPRWTLFLEHLSPNPAQGACGDRMFTPTESLIAENRRFIEGACEVEQQLAARRVTGLVITHSAPWYTVRFAMPVLTRYFAPARAYTPLQQRELVDDLRRGRAQALLRATGHGALAMFDIPDALRVPVVDAYLRARRQGVNAVATPLGDLYFWNEPPSCEASPDPQEGGRVVLRVDLLARYGPGGGLLFAQGSATDGEGGALRSLTIESAPSVISPRFEYGISNADQPENWELTARLPEGRTNIEDLAPVRLVAIGLDGKTARADVPIRTARVLPPLSGTHWRDLAASISESEERGFADRAAACKALGPSGCRCEPRSGGPAQRQPAP